MQKKTLPDLEWPVCFGPTPVQLTTQGQTEAQRKSVLWDGYKRAQHRLANTPTRPAPAKG